MMRRHTLLAAAALFACGALHSYPEDAPEGTWRTYEVRELIDGFRDAPWILAPRGKLIFAPRGARPPAEAGSPLFGEPEPIPPPPPEVEPFPPEQPPTPPRLGPRRGLDPDALYGAIYRLFLEDRGDSLEIHATGGSLEVWAPGDTHEAIGSWIAELRRQARVQVAVDCVLLPVDALDALAPSWESTGPALGDDILQRALLDPRARVFSTVARSGQRVALGERKLSPMLTGSEVNQTGVIPVNIPLVEAPWEGDRLEVQPFSLSGGDRVRLDLVAGRFAVRAGRTEVGWDWGELELPATEQRLISTSTVVPAGKTVLLGAIEGTHDLAVLARARVRGESREREPLPGEAGMSLVVHDIADLLRTDSRSWPAGMTGTWFVEGWPYRRQVESLEAYWSHVRKRCGEESLRLALLGNTLSLLGTRDALEMAKRPLDARRDEATEAFAILVEAWSLPRALAVELLARGEDGLVLGPGWRELLEGSEGASRRRHFATGVPGEIQALFGAEVRTYLVGMDQVSGGTGFAIVERSQPVTATCGDGAELWLLAETSADPSTVRIHIEGADARIARERTVTATFVTAQDRGEEPPSGIARKDVPIVFPEQSVVPWSAEAIVPLDRDVILHAEIPEGKGAATILVGRLRRT